MKESEIDELKKEVHLRKNQLLELVDAAWATRSALEETVEEKTTVLEKVQVAEDQAQNSDAQADYIPEKASKNDSSSY